MGCGDHAFSAHFPAIALVPEIELVSVCDSYEPSAKRAQGMFGARSYYTDYKELLKREEVDVIDVITPEYAHAPVVVASAEAGKHVICEKPMANSLQECDQMISAARKNRVKFMVAHSRRFWKKYKDIKNIVDSGVIGKIVLQKQLELRPKNMLITHKHSYSSETNPLGALSGKGGHSVDLFRWYLRSNIKKVFAVGRSTKKAVYPGSDALDHMKTMFTFEDGSTAFIEANDIAPRNCPYYFPILEIVGTKGKINASDYSMISVSAVYDEKLWVPFSRRQFLAGLGTPFVDELQYFARCVLEDREPNYISLEDARAVIEAVVAANISIKRGEPVSLPL